MAAAESNNVLRPWLLRMRHDLRVRCETFGGQATWIVSDPLSLRHLSLDDEEYFALTQLDGRTSPDELKRRIESRYPGRAVPGHELESLVNAFHRHGLLIAESAGQGDRLWNLSQAARNPWRRLRIGNLLSLRLGGMNPGPLLALIYPWVRPGFHPAGVAACVAAMLAAITLVLAHADDFYRRLPAFEQFFAAERVGWMLVALAATKCLHELGHGLTLTHFGGKCRRIGVMLLVFTPSLYCDVSDAWRIPSGRRRALISFAGMYVDLLIASACTFVWWFTTPGTLHYLSLNVMFLCSVGTLLFNANPLLRFDGYYILSDLWRTPNLWQRSRGVLATSTMRYVLGIKTHEEPLSLSRRIALGGYALASIIYGWAVLIGIGLFIMRLSEAWRIERMGCLFAALLWFAAAVEPLLRVTRFLHKVDQSSMTLRSRLFVVCVVAVAAASTLLLVPLPYYVEAVAEARPGEMRRLFVEAPGFYLKPEVPPDGEVSQGRHLTTLVNPDLEAEVVRARSRCDQLRRELSNLEARRSSDPESERRIPTVAAELADSSRQAEQWERDQLRLRLSAPQHGVVYPPLDHQSGFEQGSEAFDDPWDIRHVGRYLESGTPFCLIGSRDQREAVLTVDQVNAGEVAVGQTVSVKWDASPFETLRGVIVEVASRHDTGADYSGASPNDDSPAERRRETGDALRVRVKLDGNHPALPIGSYGRAKIRATPRSLGSRLRRHLYNTFDFH